VTIPRSIKTLIRTILFLCFAAGPVAVNAQADSASYSLRHFDKQALDKYSSDRDFRYENITPPEDSNIWSWLKYQLLKLLYRVFGEREQAVTGRIVMYLLMIFAVVMIVLNITGIEIRRFFVREAKVVMPTLIGEENIREMNMDELIADAAARKQWRLSVRYQYLKALRLLTDRGLIRWRVGKTNMDYYHELNDATLKEMFLKATDDFENAWYGNGEVTEAHYRESKSSLEIFYTEIQNSKG
jgi:hypothetical protein